jgi:hypothetical protein
MKAPAISLPNEDFLDYEQQFAAVVSLGGRCQGAFWSLFYESTDSTHECFAIIA